MRIHEIRLHVIDGMTYINANDLIDTLLTDKPEMSYDTTRAYIDSFVTNLKVHMDSSIVPNNDTIVSIIKSSIWELNTRLTELTIAVGDDVTKLKPISAVVDNCLVDSSGIRGTSVEILYFIRKHQLQVVNINALNEYWEDEKESAEHRMTQCDNHLRILSEMGVV